MDVLGLSQRRACLIVGIARSSFQRAHKHAKDVVTFDKYAELRQWLHTWAAQNPRWGYRRAWIKTKEEGFDVGRDVVRRVWRQENLRVPSRKRSKPKTLADPTPGWSQQHVRMMCGRWISSSIRTITAGQSRSAT